MIAKVNANVQFKSKYKKVVVELWDIDVLMDDKIASHELTRSGHIEFLFSLSVTGEVNPELQLRIKDEAGNEVLRTPIDQSISAMNIDKNTGFLEHTTIDFGVIKID
jgi:hypothetical protein